MSRNFGLVCFCLRSRFKVTRKFENVFFFWAFFASIWFCNVSGAENYLLYCQTSYFHMDYLWVWRKIELPRLVMLFTFVVLPLIFNFSPLPDWIWSCILTDEWHGFGYLPLDLVFDLQGFDSRLDQLAHYSKPHHISGRNWTLTSIFLLSEIVLLITLFVLKYFWLGIVFFYGRCVMCCCGSNVLRNLDLGEPVVFEEDEADLDMAGENSNGWYLCETPEQLMP